MHEIGGLSDDEYSAAIERPLTVVKQESEGTDENYQSSYAIHCAALELMKLDNFDFQYTFQDKDSYTEYMDRYKTVYTEKSDLIRAGGFKIYTSLDSNLQETASTRFREPASSWTTVPITWLPSWAAAAAKTSSTGPT